MGMDIKEIKQSPAKTNTTMVDRILKATKVTCQRNKNELVEELSLVHSRKVRCKNKIAITLTKYAAKEKMYFTENPKMVPFR